MLLLVSQILFSFGNAPGCARLPGSFPLRLEFSICSLRSWGKLHGSAKLSGRPYARPLPLMISALACARQPSFRHVSTSHVGFHVSVRL